MVRNIINKNQEDKLEQNHIKSKLTFFTLLSYKPILYFFFFISIFAAIILSKDYIFSIIAKQDFQKEVHQDNTQIQYKLSNENVDLVKLSEEKITSKVKEILEKIKKKQIEQSKQFDKELIQLLNNEFRSSYSNIQLFADWFYSYTTQYKILLEGSKGIVDRYRGAGSDFTIIEAAKNNIEEYISNHYKNIVLKPHLLEASLKLNLSILIEKYTNNKDLFMKDIDDDFEKFLRETEHELSEIQVDRFNLDWKSNIRNASKLLSYKNKDGEGGLTTLGGITTISLLAAKKVSTVPVGKLLARKIIAKIGTGKIASMALIKVASVAVGGITFGIGTVLGFGADYLINEGDETLNRENFEIDSEKSLDNIKKIILYEIVDNNIIEMIYKNDINIYKKFININFSKVLLVWN